MPNEINSNAIRSRGGKGAGLDLIDRKILGELSVSTDVGYAELGERVGLSAPAVHERVKRLRAAGIIKRNVAIVDGPAVGKALLAFVHVDTTGWGKTAGLMDLAVLPEIEEIHSVTGDTCMMLKVRVADSVALEGLLAKLYDLPEVRGTRTYVVLSTYLERSPQPGITADLSNLQTLKPTSA
ncbi:MAG: Lrp/AsnC family transcriptional regulator [Alphaproteobacteria bacterium]|nr:Lrp/AsnC family transcriptional regulator [Alphaproteobacteria bacterium]